MAQRPRQDRKPRNSRQPWQQARPERQAPPPGAAAGASTETVERPLAAHVQSPEFAPALGAQLNILVKDGVSEARLHLNPAEMGPITVQIHIEGQTARVEMVAEHAATRQALEQSMPALAGALRESGLTLTGGGVFEQARDPRQGEPEGRPGRGGIGGTGGLSADGSEPGPDSGRPVRLPAGVVDIYA
jgi:flagellar hook-length control protein FliK